MNVCLSDPIHCIMNRKIKYNPKNTDDINQLIDNLFNEVIEMSKAANAKANFCKIFYILTALYTIIAGALIAILSIKNNTNEILLYIAGILAAIITAVHTFLLAFPLNKQAIKLKMNATKLIQISRKLQILRNNSNIPTEDKVSQLEEYYTKVDDLDISLFKIGLKYIKNLYSNNNNQSNENNQV